MRRWLVFCSLIAFVMPVTAAPANRCEEYHRDYKVATAKVGAALQHYADCIDNGDPTYACSSQYAHLRSAQRLLEISTYNYGHYCRSRGRSASDR